MNELHELSADELFLLKEIEISMNKNMESPEIKLTDSTVCRALITTRPIPNRSFEQHLAQQIFPQTKNPSEGKRIPIKARRTSVWMLPVFSVIISLLFLFGTPAGRGLAQEILSFFERESESAIPESNIMHTPLPAMVVDLDKGDENLKFHLLFPGYIPEGYEYSSLEIDPKGNYLTLTFNGPVSTNGVISPSLMIQQQSTPFQELIGPDAEVEILLINSNPGEYVEGGWVYISNSDVGETGSKTFHWEESIVPMQRLRWKVKNVFIEIIFVGSDTTKGFLDRNDLLIIAESLNNL